MIWNLARDVGDHVLNGDLFRRRASAVLALAGLQLHRAAGAVDLALVLDGGLDHLGLPNLLHEVGDAALLDELRADVFGKRGELLQLRANR